MREAATRHLYSYWNALRNGRPAPRRFDIEPSRIADSLPDTFILEAAGTQGTEGLRFRLAGTRLCDAFGLDWRGRPFAQFWNDADRPAMAGVLTRVVEDAVVGVVTLQAREPGGGQVDGEMVLLPLTHMDDAISRILGCLVLARAPEAEAALPASRDAAPSRHADAGRTTQRGAHLAWSTAPSAVDHLSPLAMERLVSVALHWPDSRRFLTGPRAPAVTAFTPTPASSAGQSVLDPAFATARIVMSKRRAFRVVDGGRDAT